MITSEEIVLSLIRSALIELSPEDQEKVRAVRDELIAIVKRDAFGGMALALVGAEMAVEGWKFTR